MELRDVLCEEGASNGHCGVYRRSVMKIKLTWLYAFQDWQYDRRQVKEERWREWHRWFAWKPKIINGHIFWFEWVERRRTHYETPMSVDKWGHLDFGANFWDSDYRRRMRNGS